LSLPRLTNWAGDHVGDIAVGAPLMAS